MVILFQSAIKKKNYNIRSIQKKNIRYSRNLNTSNQENFKRYNKNIDPVIEYANEGNIISWNGKSAVSEPMSKEEVKELEALINEIIKGDE